MVDTTVVMCSREILQSRTLQALASIKLNTYESFNIVLLETCDFRHPADLNKALYSCNTKYFVTADDDIIVVSKGWLESFKRVLEDNSDIGAIQALLLTPNNEVRVWAGLANLIQGKPSGLMDIGYACTAFSIFRTDLLKQLNGFDTNYIKWAFDVDVSWMIKELGYRITVIPEVQVIHFESQTTKPSWEIEYNDYTYLIRKWFITNRFKSSYSSNNARFIDYWRSVAVGCKENE